MAFHIYGMKDCKRQTPQPSCGSLETDDCSVLSVFHRSDFRASVDGVKQGKLLSKDFTANDRPVNERFSEECFDSGVALSIPPTELFFGSGSHSHVDSSETCPKLSKEHDEAAVDYQMNWDLIFEQDQEGDTQLHIALMLDSQQDLVLSITNLCPDAELLDLQNDLHQTALHLAVILRRTQALQALVSRGARIFICDQNGNTPLHLACQLGYTEAVHVLTNRFQSKQEKLLLYQIIHHKNYEGLTCCHLSALSLVPDNLFHLTEDCGANINIQEGKRGMTVLHMAAEAKNITLVTFLVYCPNINLNQLTYDGWTALDLAAGRHLTEIEKLLCSVGALCRNSVEEICSDTDSSEESLELDVNDPEIFRYMSLHTEPDEIKPVAQLNTNVYRCNKADRLKPCTRTKSL